MIVRSSRHGWRSSHFTGSGPPNAWESAANVSNSWRKRCCSSWLGRRFGGPFTGQRLCDHVIHLALLGAFEFFYLRRRSALARRAAVPWRARCQARRPDWGPSRRSGPRSISGAKAVDTGTLNRASSSATRRSTWAGLTFDRTMPSIRSREAPVVWQHRDVAVLGAGERRSALDDARDVELRPSASAVGGVEVLADVRDRNATQPQTRRPPAHGRRLAVQFEELLQRIPLERLAPDGRLAAGPDAGLVQGGVHRIAAAVGDRQRRVPADEIVPVGPAELAREVALDEDQVVPQVHPVRRAPSTGRRGPCRGRRRRPRTARRGIPPPRAGSSGRTPPPGGRIPARTRRPGAGHPRGRCSPRRASPRGTPAPSQRSVRQHDACDEGRGLQVRRQVSQGLGDGASPVG